MKQKTIWTIGHSTHTLNEFIAMLQSFKIELLADIRSLPGSNHFPQFNKENLMISLPNHQIQYTHLLNLGGRRKVHKDSHNIAWHHPAFRSYADYMETKEFEQAINELEQLAKQQKTAIMCAEAVWWRCHRSLVSDWLKCNDWLVLHIMGVNKFEEHPYTKAATIKGNILSYTTKK